MFTPGGSNTVDVQIKSKGDGLYGTNRSFTVTFSNPQGAAFADGANEQATGTITEADQPPLMGISRCNGSTVNAGDQATFLVLLAGAHPPTTLPASVDYATVGDSTVAGDFEPTSGTLTIPAGQREFDLHVQTKDNPPVGDRSFHVQLSNPQNVRLDNSLCVVHHPQHHRWRRQPGVDHDHRPRTGDAADQRLRARQRQALAHPADPAAVEPAAGVGALADAGRKRGRRDRLHRGLR